ncbi:o-succinylbenzoate synthase [Labilibaculum euxinus]|uniref:O-succinylbenzoate synthase n=1 Tax=Labilibaculum euxinus TaxID=2686357 RepID=A0A7M4D7B9_9BACT|nr:o-succinylbenzoate synthase [Labilibaculum euxinus]MUP38548.1 o-succinylbenzoate synthase [Labilibaculum euxinus]MVB07753.1 o-succinylbenzoate synthase [Labilibaculum euxinus]
MLKADYQYYPLKFKRVSGTSRGVLTQKDSWFIRIWDDKNPDVKGIGECSIIPGLSSDDKPGYENKIKEICESIDDYWYYLEDGLTEWPSIYFGLETAFLDFQAKGSKVLFPSDFTNGKAQIPINGLVWMGDSGYMKEQIQQKLEDGFDCLKLKIGAIDFKEEINLLQSIRKDFGSDKIELRVDANGAFSPVDALNKLKVLSEFQIHSIEQPIKAGQWKEMADLCLASPMPIALDEELIGVHAQSLKKELLDAIKPQYIILKPSLLGGIKGSQEWIDLAEERNIPWWVTSALESNIGLNAIAQWTYTLNNSMPQGLGTGQIYSNNIVSPLFMHKGFLAYDICGKWEI